MEPCRRQQRLVLSRGSGHATGSTREPGTRSTLLCLGAYAVSLTLHPYLFGVDPTFWLR